MRYLIYTLFLTFAALVASCNRGDNGLPNAGAVRVTFSSAYANAPGAVVADPEKIGQLNAYLCSEGVVKKVFMLDALSDLIIDEEYHYPTSKLYVIANPSGCKALENVGQGSAEAVFATLPLEGDISSVPLCGVVDLTGKVDQKVSVALERSVARFDLKIDADRGIEVISVNLEGLPKKGMLFPAQCDYTDRVKHLATVNATASVEGLWYSYELPSAAGGLVATLDVRYNGVLATLVVPINELKRNYIYNLNVQAYDGKVAATLEASTMDEGDSDSGVASFEHTVIDQTNSVLGKGTTLTSPTMINLPNKNCEITLALTGDYHKNYEIVGDTNGFMITAVTGTTFNNSRIKIQATRNLEYYAPGRAVMLLVSHVDKGNTVNDRISVLQSAPEPFPIVTMGGIEWMGVNSLGQDHANYPIVPKWQSVRDFMKVSDNWHKFGTACYQWGPRRSYNTVSPFHPWWVLGGSFNDINGPITAMPAGNVWQGETVPCPLGWRLPTYEECERIWAPHDKTLPQTYVKNGVTYTMSLEDTGLFVDLSVHGRRKLHNVIISNDTNELVFPAAGVRYENNADVPGTINGYAAKIGSAFALRTQKAVNNSGYNAGVGYAIQNQDPNIPAKVVLTSGTHPITVAQTYCYIRCVRDIE